MNTDTMHLAGGLPSVINPSMMNGSSSNTGTGNSNIAPDKKPNNNKNSKISLDKNGKPKRKKASRGESSSPFPARVKGCVSLIV